VSIKIIKVVEYDLPLWFFQIMLIKAQRVSKKRDNLTWCRPSRGYCENAIKIEIGDYDEYCSIPDELPDNDCVKDDAYPEFAPIAGYVLVEGRILKKKSLKC
jgi:hypothetical protein